MTKTFKN